MEKLKKIIYVSIQWITAISAYLYPFLFFNNDIIIEDQTVILIFNSIVVTGIYIGLKHIFRIQMFFLRPPLKILTNSGYRYGRVCRFYQNGSESAVACCTTNNNYYVAFYDYYLFFWVRKLRSDMLSHSDINNPERLKRQFTDLDANLVWKERSKFKILYKSFEDWDKLVTNKTELIREKNIDKLLDK